MTLVRYELHCLDKPPLTEFSHDYPLAGVTRDEWWAAIDIADVMLIRSAQAWDRHVYKSGLNRIDLPKFGCYRAHVDLSIEKLDYKSVLAISEICLTMRCFLRPLDGGPDISADPQGIVQDLMRRAEAALSPQGLPLSEVIYAAKQAVKEARSKACAEARAIRDAQIKRRKQKLPAGEAAQAAH